MLSIPIKIKIEMLKKGITGAEIARRAGVDRSAICITIKGKIKSKKLRKAIASALKMRVEELWGDTQTKVLDSCLRRNDGVKNKAA